MPLVLQREIGESIVLTTEAGERIVVRLDRRPGQAASKTVLVVDAPRSVRVMRQELEERDEAR